MSRTTNLSCHNTSLLGFFILLVGAGACVLFEKDATGAWHQLEKFVLCGLLHSHYHGCCLGCNGKMLVMMFLGAKLVKTYCW